MRQPTQYLNQAFEASTIDAVRVSQWLNQLPDLLGIAYQHGYSKEIQKIANYTDFVDFHLRRYLSGHAKNLRRVNQEIVAFQAFNSPQAEGSTIAVVAILEKHLLTCEWYELMPRLQDAKEKISKRFGFDFPPINHYFSVIP
jgi:hypothetical protein